MSLVTPIEPVAQPPRAARERLVATQCGELATAWSRLGIAAASARGRHHRVNEDCHSTLEGTAPVFVVADGVGGGAMAAWTSRRLVADVQRSLAHGRIDAGAVRTALLAADGAIARRIAERGTASGAATAVVCAGTGPRHATWILGWVGDCRAYRVGRGPVAELLTRDDTYAHLGEQPPPGGSPDDPARMIGNGAVSEPNVARIVLGVDESLVLVSDGVHKHVEPAAMARMLGDDAPLVSRCLRLVRAARAQGSEDDATVLVIQRRARQRPRMLRHAAILLAALVALALLLTWSLPAAGLLPATSPSSPSRPQPEPSP